MSQATIYRSEAGRQAILTRYEAALANWSVPFETMAIGTAFGSTFVIACGDKASHPVVLLHGSSTNSAMWAADAARLSRTYRVYAVDIIGEPGKSAESRPAMRDSNYARWLGEVLDGLNVPSAVVIGNSLGGWIALDFATASPGRVTKLVLLAASGVAPTRGSFMLKAIPLMMMGQPGLDQLNRMVFGDAPVPEEVLEFVNLVAKQYRPRTAPLRVFTNAELKELTMPVLYVGGDRDALLRTSESARRLDSLLPNVKTVVLPGVHHALIDQYDRIQAFLGA